MSMPEGWTAVPILAGNVYLCPVIGCRRGGPLGFLNESKAYRHVQEEHMAEDVWAGLARRHYV